MKRKLFIIVCSVWVVIAFAGMTFAEDETRPSTIEVTGTARVMVQPNVATITFSVETTAARAARAVSANAERTARVLDVLRGLGGKETKLKTSGFSLSPMYSREERLSLEGYRVGNTVILETKLLDKVGSFIDKASEAGASRIGGLGFTTDRTEELRKEAGIKAVKQAMQTAEELAKAAGLTIERVLKLSYGPRHMVRPYQQMEAAPARAATPIEIGEITIEESVDVVFEAN
jgi:hypothetical protein